MQKLWEDLSGAKEEQELVCKKGLFTSKVLHRSYPELGGALGGTCLSVLPLWRVSCLQEMTRCLDGLRSSGVLSSWKERSVVQISFKAAKIHLSSWLSKLRENRFSPRKPSPGSVECRVPPGSSSSHSGGFLDFHFVPWLLKSSEIGEAFSSGRRLLSAPV